VLRPSSPQHQVKSAAHLPWRICTLALAQTQVLASARGVSVRAASHKQAKHAVCSRSGEKHAGSCTVLAGSAASLLSTLHNGGAVLAIGRYSQCVHRCVVLQKFTARTPKKELGGWHIQKRGFGRLGFAKPSREIGMYHLLSAQALRHLDWLADGGRHRH
jgi:hypothetical protein